MPLDSVVDGARSALIAVFALSLVEKGTSLWSRSAAWHPLMLVSTARRRWASALMAVAFLADLAAIALLALLPTAGGAAATALIVAYTWLALPVHAADGHGCRCFWKVLDSTTRQALLARNAVLFALALAVVISPPGAAGIAGPAWGVGLLVGLAALVGGLNVRTRSATIGTSPMEPGATERTRPFEISVTRRT